MATIKIKQIKSKIGYPVDQKRTLVALGLRKISQVVEVEDTPSIRGMIRKVHHLVTVIDVDSIMKLNNLKPAEGSTHSRRRIGRGPGSGLGGTSTRGHKGAKARSGYKRKIGFEGGQMPLQRRLPKGGFKNINHKEYFAVNLSTLQKLAEEKNLTKIGLEELKAAGLTNGKELVKVLGNGEIKAKIEVQAHAFSKTAEEAIKAVGGNATKI